MFQVGAQFLKLHLDVSANNALVLHIAKCGTTECENLRVFETIIWYQKHEIALVGTYLSETLCLSGDIIKVKYLPTLLKLKCIENCA